MDFSISTRHENTSFCLNQKKPEKLGKFLKFSKLMIEENLQKSDFRIGLKRPREVYRDMFLTTAFGYEAYGLPSEGLDKNFDEFGRQLNPDESLRMIKSCFGSDKLFIFLSG